MRATGIALLPLSQPRLVTIMVGVNDCVGNKKINQTAWVSTYVDLLKRIHAAGATPIIMSILPVEDNPKKSLGTKYFSEQCIDTLNKSLATLASSRKEIYINLSPLFIEKRHGQNMHPGWTIDGVHPNGVAMRVLHDRIETAVSDALRSKR